MDRCGIYINGVYDNDRDVRIVDVTDAFGPLHICLLPYIDPAAVRSCKKFTGVTVATFDDVVAAVLATIPFQEDERYVLVAHQFVAGCGVTPLSSASERIMVGGVLSRWTPTSFRHLSMRRLVISITPQKIGLPTIRYAGSPLKYSSSERGSQKSVTVVEFFEKGSVKISQIPLTPLHDLRIICGTLDDLTTKEQVHLPHDDYFFVQITDPVMPADAMARLRVVYPNVIDMEMVNEQSPVVSAAGARMEDLQKSDRDLFAGFFTEVTGRAMTEFQETIVRETLGEPSREA